MSHATEPRRPARGGLALPTVLVVTILGFLAWHGSTAMMLDPASHGLATAAEASR